MNKNLKRALNTTAAVSMSLAMVLGAVAPTTVGAWNSAVTSQSIKFDSAAKFTEAFINEIGDVYSVKLTGDENKITLSASFKKNYTLDADNANLEALLNATANVATGTDAIANDSVETILQFYVDNFETYGEEADQDIYEAAAHLVGKPAVTHKNIVTAVSELQTLVDELGYDSVDEVDVTSYNKALFERADKLDAYAGNLAEENDTEIFNEWFSQMTDAKGDHDAENEDENIQDYIDALEDARVTVAAFKEDGTADTAKTLTVRELVEREAEVHYSNVSKIERLIKQIKNDDAFDAELGYDDVKDESEVAEMVEGLEAIVEDMKEAKELLKSTSAAAKDYAKVEDKVEVLVKAVVEGKEPASTTTRTTTWVDADNQEEAIDNALTAFRASDVAKLKTYVEEVFNQFYTVTPKETSRGTYVLRLENADYGRYVNVAKDFDAKLVDLLTTPVDKTEGEESYYDVLVGENATVDELYAAVTEDIEGLTLDSKITSTDAQKIIAAKKALDRLMDTDRKEFEGEGTKLTYKEQKEVKSNATLIDTLYLKLIINGEVTTIGWVETPQGWEYYDNNGKRVMEGWAPGNGYWSYMKNGYSVANDWCAAKEGWYYMGADGKMVTGIVTIDGVDYNFGTDGIWVR